MEAEKSNSVKKSRREEELTLEAFRRRYNNLIVAFKLFFISLTLITLALITYLAQSESLDESIHDNPPSLPTYNPIITTESEIFNLSIQRAAQQLELATSLILNYTSSNNEAKTELAFNNCRELLQNGSDLLREAIRADPFPGRPSNRQRVEMAGRIVAAEIDINSCLDDLAAAESSAAADEVRAAVIRAAAYLSERGDFLMSYREKMVRKWWKMVGAAMVMENLIIICLLGFQMSFIFFLFWKTVRSP